MSEIKTPPAAYSPVDPELAVGNAQLARAKALKSQELKDEKAIDKATSGFEALLLHQMMKAMWETVEFTGMLGEDSNAAGIYRDMFSQAVADTVAEGKGIGVKEYLRKELNHGQAASKIKE